VSKATQERVKKWTLLVVQAALVLTVSSLFVGSISTIWFGKRNETFWWLLMALPQVSIALFAVLICWDSTSRPEGSGVVTGMLNMFGLLGALAFGKWLPAVIGILTIIAMVVRPRRWIYSNPPPPRFGRLRRLGGLRR
jgi:hypothetical protein